MHQRPTRTQGSPGPTRVVGLLGGIASGKSAAAKLLAGPSGCVIEADRLAHAELESEPLRARLQEHFGRGAFRADGSVDRSAVARRVFGDPALRAQLEAWIHPRVRERIRAELSLARASGVPRVVLDVPLLLENDAQHGLVAECDWLVFVDSPPEERDRRARSQRGWEAGELARRESAQWPLERKRERAHHVLPNTGDLAALEWAVRQFLVRVGLEPPA
jgi:dephospho-CoA kinase